MLFLAGSLLWFFSISSLNAQEIKVSAHASWQSFALTFAREQYNGYGIGALVSMKDGKSILHYYAGADYNHLATDHYKLNMFGVPAGFDLDVGKRFGFFFGAGVEPRWLINKRSINIEYAEKFNSFVLSWFIRGGILANLQSLSFRLYPRFDFPQTPLVTNYPFGQAHKADLYLKVFSVNLEVGF